MCWSGLALVSLITSRFLVFKLLFLLSVHSVVNLLQVVIVIIIGASNLIMDLTAVFISTCPFPAPGLCFITLFPCPPVQASKKLGKKNQTERQHSFRDGFGLGALIIGVSQFFGTV